MKKIRYNLDMSSLKSEEKYIFLNISHYGKRIKVSTKQKVKPSEWNYDQYRAIYCNITNTKINNILHNIETNVVEYINQCYESNEPISVNTIKNIVKEVLECFPQKDIYKISEDKLFTRDRYFARYYEYVTEHGDMIRAYYDVELEWNAVGVSMCPNYEAFKVAKSRYFAKKKRGYKIKAI